MKGNHPGRRVVALLLILTMCLSLFPVVFATGEASKYGTLTVEYYVEGSETQIAPTYKASILLDSGFEVVSPTIKGYRVVDSNNETLSVTLSQEKPTRTIKVFYKPDNTQVAYRVNYIGRDVTGKILETLGTVKETGAIGTVVTAEDKDFTEKGYVRDAGSLDLYVTMDGKAELNVYYTKMVPPYIIFKTDGSYVKPITAKAGEEIPQEKIDNGLLAVCGMNCLVCYRYCDSRKPCSGCHNRKIKDTRRCQIQDCAASRSLRHCFDCADYPCKQILRLERNYNKRYGVSLIEDSRSIQELGRDDFFEQQRERYRCPDCGGIISIHDKVCSERKKARG